MFGRLRPSLQRESLVSSKTANELRDSHVILSCEGTAEQVIVDKLVGADVTIFPADNVIAVTRMRKAAEIQEEFLDYDYDWPVSVLRVLDSRKERFRLGNLYADRFPVHSFITHPEIEILVIIREGEWERWSKSGARPSIYCKQQMKMKDVKSRPFLEGCWTPELIAKAAVEYRRLSKIPRGELCLADLIDTGKILKIA